MKKLTSILLSILMTVSLTACSSVSEDADKYIAYCITMLGMEMEPSEIYHEDIVLALDEKGKAEFTLEGTTFNCKWEVDEEEFILSQGKDEFTGTMIDDMITIVNILDSGMDISFLKEGAEPPVDTSKPMGKYMLSGMDMYGLKMSYVDIQTANMSMDLEFEDDGTVVMSSNGDVLELPIDYDANTIDFDGLISEFVFEDEQFTIISEEEGMTMKMIFTAEDSEKWTELEAEGSTIEDGFVDSGDDTFTSEFIAPGYGAETTVSVEELSVPSDWYGVINITDYEGPYTEDMPGEHEAWATLSNDGIADYFEIYVDGIYEDGNVILSYYAEVYNYTFYPIADDDAWIFDTYLTEDDETWYTPTLINGVLSASYDYVDDDESFTFTYELSMIEGTNSKRIELEPTETPQETTKPVATETPQATVEPIPTETAQTDKGAYGIAFLGFGEEFNDADLSSYLPVIEHNGVEPVLLDGHSFFLLIPSSEDIFFEIYGIGKDSNGDETRWQAAETSPGSPVLIRCNDWYDPPSVLVKVSAGDEDYDFFTPLYLAKENKMQLERGAYNLEPIA